MAEGLNRVMLIGNLGADPDLKFGQSGGDGILKLRVATTESYFDKRSNERKDRTDWHNVTLFGKRGEALSRMLKKGSRIYVEGRIETRSYEKDGQKHYVTDVVALNVILLDGRGEGGERQEDRPRDERPREERIGGRSFNSRDNTYSRGGDSRGRPQSGGGGDDYGSRSDPGDDDDDIPFVTQTDTTRRWLQ